jgi:hypothetical protein
MTAMMIQVDFWNVAGAIVTLIGAFWTLISMMVKQFDAGLTRRFTTMEEARAEEEKRDSERFNRIEGAQKQHERELLQLKADIPDRYVKREDAIRSEVTLHAKFDGLAGKIDMFMMREKKND